MLDVFGEDDDAMPPHWLGQSANMSRVLRVQCAALSVLLGSHYEALCRSVCHSKTDELIDPNSLNPMPSISRGSHDKE